MGQNRRDMATKRGTHLRSSSQHVLWTARTSVDMSGGEFSSTDDFRRRVRANSSGWSVGREKLKKVSESSDLRNLACICQNSWFAIPGSTKLRY